MFLNYYNISEYSLVDLYGKLPACCFGYEKNKIKRYVREDDQKRSLIGKIATVKMISELLNVSESELIFNRDSFDKPVLKKPFLKNFNFNIAHSGEYVVLGVDDKGRIGVDVEKIKPIDLEIMKTVFTDVEIQHINSDEEYALENFYLLWSLKESFVKAIGEGLSFPLKKFHFEFKKNEIIHKINSKKSNWSFEMYNLDKGYKLAVCLELGSFPAIINKGCL